MNLHQLVSSAPWPEVRAALLWLYADVEDSLGDYRTFFENLQIRTPGHSNMRIVIAEDRSASGMDQEPSYLVTGSDGTRWCDMEATGLSEEALSRLSAEEVRFSLSFAPIDRWLGMEIDAGTLSSFTPAQVAAHCLWEMTFYGFDEGQVDELRENLSTTYTNLVEREASQTVAGEHLH